MLLHNNIIDGGSFPMSEHHMHQGLSAALAAYRAWTSKVEDAAKVVDAATSKARHGPAVLAEYLAACFII